MKLPHLTQHGTRQSGDALDVFIDETELLDELFDKWKATTPDRSVGDEVVSAKWDHGTVGKLLLEHAAVRLAASEELARVLSAEGKDALASLLRDENMALRPLLDQMYDAARGVQPISVAITPEFIGPVESLFDLIGPALGPKQSSRLKGILATALGLERRRLRSATYIRKHAPAHPGPPGRWYDRVPFLVRLRAGEDRLRGFPWGESSLADRKLARRYDREI